MHMPNAFTHNALCSCYHLKIPCLIKTQQKSCIINEIKCCRLTPHNAVQGTGCNMTLAEILV